MACCFGISEEKHSRTEALGFKLCSIDVFTCVVQRDKTRFHLVLKSSRTGGEKAAAGEREVMGG